MDFKEFRYPKPLRFDIGKHVGKKRYMSKADENYLLSGRVIVEEKMDGKETTFRNREFIFCAEDLKVRHSIAYHIPARYTVFDIFSLVRGLFLCAQEKADVTRFYMRNRNLLPRPLAQGGIFPIRQLALGVFGINDLPALISISAYAVNSKTKDPDFMEGIVVKPDRELLYEEHLSGKIVRKEFLDGVRTHYLRMRRELNQIDPLLPETEMEGPLTAVK